MAHEQYIDSLVNVATGLNGTTLRTNRQHALDILRSEYPEMSEKWDAVQKLRIVLMCLHDYRAIVAEAASVTSAVSEDKPHVIYDLQGRLTDKPARGVYIEDGWKRVVK